MKKIGFLCRVCLLAAALLHPRAAVIADGGTLRLSQRKQDYQITVFTSPTPLRSGPVDVSVLVQDAATGEPIPQVRVLVRAMPRGHPGEGISQPATSEAATNKLFRAAVFDLPEPGLWDMEIIIEESRGPVEIHFEMGAEEPLPRLGEMWPWIAWPAAAILFFGVHQWLVRRSLSTTAKTRSGTV
ncbi:MAG TPA: hypothetical protein VH643_27625 [Gemmataceae bacterium]|jgi:hypothetical protein